MPWAPATAIIAATNAAHKSVNDAKKANAEMELRRIQTQGDLNRLAGLQNVGMMGMYDPAERQLVNLYHNGTQTLKTSDHRPRYRELSAAPPSTIVEPEKSKFNWRLAGQILITIALLLIYV